MTIRFSQLASTITLLYFASVVPVAAQFTRQYGTALDEAFGKVIPHGSEYYVLGSGVPAAGQTARATVSRISATGQLLWTRRLDIASQWNDAVLTPGGNLLVVGHTLPLDANSQSLMGVITPSGTFSWVRTYNVPGRESFNRVARNPAPSNAGFPYYVLGFQQEPGAVTNWDDVVLLTVSEAGNIGWKKIYSGLFGSTDDEFVRDLEALPNGDLLLAGNWGTNGVIFRADNTGAITGGASPGGIQMTFTDVAQAGSNFIAAGFQFPAFSARLMKFNADLITLWQISLPGLTAIRNVWTSGSSIYVTGSATVGGLNRGVVLKFQDGGSAPTLQWMKYLQVNETAYTGGTAWPVSGSMMAFVDGRVRPDGFGGDCAFLSVSDLEMNTCMTQTGTTTVTNTALFFNSPCCLGIDFTDALPGMNVANSAVTWQQAEACPDPMNASIIGVKYKTCVGLPYSDQTPIAGWVIQLLNSQGTIISEQVTGADGSYAFYNLPHGQYVVREVLQPGWTPSLPQNGQLAVTLAASEQRVVNFGNCPPPQPFCACPAGSQPANNNLAANGNFSGGNTGFSSGYTFSNSSPLQPGQYWVGANPSQINAGFTSCGDHTTGSGNMLVVNGGASTSTPIWCQTYTVAPNSSYIFEAWVASLTGASPANLMLFVNNISQNAGFFASDTSCNWEKYCVFLTSGVQTSLTLCLVDLNVANAGNDFAIDDISFRRCVSPFGHISGRVYETCDDLPYTDQPVLPGWTVQLLDDAGSILAEQVTDTNGEYAFNDLPLGLYYCRVVNQPGWTPKVPPVGEYIANLDTPGETILDFGLCPDCSCDSTYVNIQPIANSNDNSSYVTLINLRQNHCFTGIEIELATGAFSETELLVGDLTVEMSSNNIVRLTPVNGDFIDFDITILRFSVTGVGDSSHIIVRTATAVLGFACTSGASFPFPNPIPASSSCCPANSTVGPELVNDGNFGPNTIFGTDYPPSAGAVVTKSYALQNGAQTGGIWSCIGKSGDPINDYFLLINGDIGPVPAIAWKQPVTVTPGLQYTFSVAVNNLTTPNPTYNPYDPNVQIQIVNALNNSIFTSQSMILPETPDQWETICLNWTPPQDPSNPNNLYRLEILSLDLNPYGNDFALDCISFRACTPPPPCDVTINTIYVDNCGHVQLDAVASGPSGYSYQWCSGESTQMLDLMLPCGSHDFCVSITCSDNTVATDAVTVVVSDNIPPTINCPQDMNFTALHPNCDIPVFGIHSLGASDNCGVPTVSYAISGVTTGSGQGDASGTTFHSGTSTVTYTATDWCNNMTSCSFDVTIECDTCACLGFSGMAFYNFLGLPDIQVGCDAAPVGLPCIGRDALYWFQWQLMCSDPLCVQNVSYSIVPAGGGPPVLTGNIAPGNPHFIAFAYAQLPGPGNYQIILTGSCNGVECTCVVNFTLPPCCVCGGFSGMTYRPTQGIMNLPFMCGDTLGVICNQTFFPQVAGMFQCIGTQCATSQTIQWELKNPAGMVIHSGPLTIQTNFLLLLDPAWFVQPGLYTLTFTGNCEGQMCPPCVLYLESAGCLCCQDYEDFCARIEAAVSYTVDNDSCKATLNIGDFECDNYIEWIDWGDGSPQQAGHFFAGGMAMHTYTASGTYEVCYLAIERGNDGFICFEKVICDTLVVACCINPPPGMVAWWPLDEPNGAPNDDIALFNNVGTPLGSPLPATTAAVVSTGMNFAAGISPNGPNSYIEVSNGSEINFGSGDFSIDAWIKLGQGNAGIYPIVDKLDFSIPGSNRGYALFVQNGQLLLRLGPDDFGGLVAAVSSASPPLSSGNWYLIAVTVERLNPKPIVTFYVNGANAGSVTPAGPGMAAANSVTTTTPLWIGGNSQLASGGATVALNEIIIDELEFFNRVLTQAEIQDIFNAGSAGKCKDSNPVSIRETPAPLSLRLFPNPTPGHFTLELPEPATPGMVIRITCLTGQTLLQQRAEAGATRQLLDAGNLPAGLYFVQVWNQGRILGVEKFVKQ